MPETVTYASSGVDIGAGDRMVQMIRHHVTRTFGPRVIDNYGGFAGLFRLDYKEKLLRRNYKEPVLIGCTDGVGSKVKLAKELAIVDTVGQDCVAMNVNDLIVTGGEPLFFLDYIGTHKLDPARMTDIVKGVADGCQLAGCALLGGETAELPDLYAPGDFDLAGFAVGVCERKRIVEVGRVQRGDVILGLASSGIHSNGYALVRSIVQRCSLDLGRVYEELADPRRLPLGQVLLTPTRIYVKSVLSILNGYRVKRVVTGMAHITGGGLPGNLCRPLPPDLDASIQRHRWEVSPILRFLQKVGRIEQDEMDQVFNGGIGYCLMVRPTFASAVARKLRRLGEKVYRIGSIVKGSGQVRIE